MKTTRTMLQRCVLFTFFASSLAHRCSNLVYPMLLSSQTWNRPQDTKAFVVWSLQRGSETDVRQDGKCFYCRGEQERVLKAPALMPLVDVQFKPSDWRVDNSN